MKNWFIMVCLVLVTQGFARATVYYVDGAKSDNSGNGTSWGAAKRDLQEAINLAVNGDQIWVKANTYLPTRDPNGSLTPANNRDKTFYILSQDIKLYGGFSGTETELSKRNPVNNPTILSGNLDASGENDAYHVLLALGRSSDCIIDGFTITNGRATGSGSFTISFNSVRIDQGNGGGLFNDNDSKPTISNCIFSDNRAISNGGGLFNDTAGAPAITNCTFLGNTAGSNGGAIYNNTAGPVVTSSAFEGNTASNGGAMGSSSGSSPVVTNCVFVANSAAANGAAIQTNGTTSNKSYLTVTNSTFYNNSGTAASSTGAALYYNNNAGGTVSNSILYNNTTALNSSDANREEIFKAGVTAELSVANSIVRDYSSTGTLNVSFGSGIATANPQFVNAANPKGADNRWRTSDDGLRLETTSPAINAGTGTTPATDILGNSRSGAVDLGAYEFSTTLPVRLVSFTAEKRETGLHLVWSVADAQGFSHFDIERSFDGQTFARIGAVPYQDNTTTYSFGDHLLKGNVYYRLRLNDLDGSHSYSRILSRKSDQTDNLTAYPNPAQTHVTVQTDKTLIGSEVALYTANGLLIQRRRLTDNVLKLDLNDVPSGIYLVATRDGQSVKIVKE